MGEEVVNGKDRGVSVASYEPVENRSQNCSVNVCPLRT